MLYALCGLSGSGKTTVLEAVLRQVPHLTRLVTYTTRQPRPGEVEGWDYYFLAERDFQCLIRDCFLVCPIQFRGYWYATSRESLRACQQTNALVVLRPDKLTCIAMYTPVIGIYMEMVGQETPVQEDLVIYEHQRICSHHLFNIPGQLNQTVSTFLRILHDQQTYPSAEILGKGSHL